MKSNSSIIKIICLVSVFLFFTNCVSMPTESITIQSGQIPPGMTGYTGTLLILKHNKAWNKYADKYISENYNGEFIFVTEDEIENYDLEIYRFILSKSNQLNRVGGTQVGGDFVATEDLYTIDRKTGKVYKTIEKTSFYGLLLKKYAKALERERSKGKD